MGTRRPTIMLGSGGDAVGPGEFEALDDAWGVDGGHDDGAKAEVFAAGGAQDPQDGGHVLGSGIEAVELLLPFADAGGHGFEVVLEGAAKLFFEHFPFDGAELADFFAVLFFPVREGWIWGRPVAGRFGRGWCRGRAVG